MKFIADALAGFVVLGTFLPFIRTDRWWVRIFDFPRAQLLLFGLIILAIEAFLYRSLAPAEQVLVGLLIVAIVIQVWHIFPYTLLARERVLDADGKHDPVNVLVANVLQENRRAEDLLQEIRKADPDIILLTEMDHWWTDRLHELERSHPHTVLHPLENTYGINLYSRLPISDAGVRTLIDDDIPSIRATITSKGGRKILFHGVHPLPPGIEHPRNKERQDSDQRDAELVVIAKELEGVDLPIIIAGDFNDVAWSHTTRLFQRISRLLDPRIGRGFFNSFNAKSRFFRYPLDHLFHSDHFKLIHMERMAYFGSDHFPINVQLDLQPQAQHQQEAPEKKPGDEREAKEILERPAGKDH